MGAPLKKPPANDGLFPHYSHGSSGLLFNRAGAPADQPHSLSDQLRIGPALSIAPLDAPARLALDAPAVPRVDPRPSVFSATILLIRIFASSTPILSEKKMPAFTGSFSVHMQPEVICSRPPCGNS